MRVKMISTSAGPSGIKQAGRVYEVSSAEGRSLCQGGYASPVGVAPIERAERATDPKRDTGRSGASTPGSGDDDGSAAASGSGSGAGSASGQASAPAAGQGRKTSAAGAKSAASVTSNGGGKRSGGGRGKGK